MKRKSQKKTATEKPAAHPDYLRESMQTHAGPAVRNMVSALRGGNRIELITDLGRRIAKLPFYVISEAELRAKYGRRNAEQILRDNAVYANRDRKRHIAGCVDYATVSVACLRALGIPARFVREGTHSYALFELNGEFYRLDPQVARTSRGNISPVVRVQDLIVLERANLSKHKQRGRYYEGTDPRDIGLDFESFYHPRERGKQVR